MGGTKKGRLNIRNGLNVKSETVKDGKEAGGGGKRKARTNECSSSSNIGGTG